MNSKDFENVVERQIDTCKNILLRKAKEYAMDDDRLHNFKNAAGMMGCDPKEALAGMMAKHTISIYDMCRDRKYHPIEMWNEKITDHINYLLLLKAIVTEEDPLCFEESEDTIQFDDDPLITAPEGQTVERKELPENINEDIIRFRKQIERCCQANCDDCPYRPDECEKGFLKEFDQLIENLKEVI